MYGCAGTSSPIPFPTNSRENKQFTNLYLLWVGGVEIEIEDGQEEHDQLSYYEIVAEDQGTDEAGEMKKTSSGNGGDKMGLCRGSGMYNTYGADVDL